MIRRTPLKRPSPIRRNAFRDVGGNFVEDPMGLTRTNHPSEYVAWQHAKRRCMCPSDHAYRYYGERGIKMCEEWLNSFAAFFAYIGPRPSQFHSLDRFPNNDGGYEPGNVRWATKKEQDRNTRRNHWISFEGRRMVLQDWAKELGIASMSLYKRLKVWLLDLAMRRGRFKKQKRSAKLGGHE